jgi:phosphate transport system substrate-binding protein
MAPRTVRARSRRLRSLPAAVALSAAAALSAPALSASAASASSPPATDETPPSGHVSLSETGSTLLYPLFQLWSGAYHQRYKNITITPQGTGSGTGISNAAEGSVDIGASDAYLSGTEVSQHKGLKNIALAISAQQVNYNVSGVGNHHIKLNGKVLSAIYQGKITMWNDPQIKAINPGLNLPAEKIVALHRSDSSGDTFLFSSYLSDQDPSGWGKSIGYGTSISFPAISNALAEDGNGGMVTGCEQTPGCVAYIGISYLTETQKGHLGEAYLQNGSGKYEQPTGSTIVAEAAALEKKTPANEALSMIDDNAPNGYPIINYEYAIVPGRETSNTVATAVKAFLYWAVDGNGGSAKRFLNAVRFQALPQPVVALSDRLIAQIRG